MEIKIRMMKFIYTNENGKSIEFSDDTKIYITDIDGLSLNKVSITEVALSSRIGSTVNNERVEPKDITVVGVYKYDPSVRKRLINTVLPKVPGKLRYIYDKENIDVYLDVIPKSTPDIPLNNRWQYFQFVFRAPFPYWKESDSSLTEFIRYESYFRFPRSFSSTEPWKISEKIVAHLLGINNEGSDDAGFVVTFKAESEVTGPELLNVDTQEHIRFTGLQMTSGDKLIVSTYENDMYVKFIRDGVVENLFYKMDDDSDFFKLKAGKNNIRFGASANEDNLLCDLMFENTYVGV